nr:uncharacterized protein LOC115263648 [Aedes albopictus]
MASRKIDASAMPPFKVGGDPRNDWMKWRKAFDRFLRANKIDNDEEKFDLLLVLGSIELQEYYDKISKYEVQNVLVTGEVETLQYDSAVTSLERYFAPQLNKRFERHLFRAMKQEESEPFHEFVFRLQGQAKRSDFVDVDDMVIDQVVEGCKSTELRKKLLTDDLTLNDIMTLGKTIEEVQKQSKQYERPTLSAYAQAPLVQRIEKRPDRYQNTESRRRCYNCNRPGHLAKETEKCAAKNAKCHGCEGQGHFKVCCRKRKREDSQQRPGPAPKRSSVHAIHDEKATTTGVFTIDDGTQLKEVLELEVGGITMNLLVDSGSPANIISRKSYAWLKQQGASILNERRPHENETNLTAFASERKIFFSDAFETEIKVPGDESGHD